MKKKYIKPTSTVIKTESEGFIILTSTNVVHPDDLKDVNDEIGNGNQLSKPYSVFDDNDDGVLW